MWSSKEWTPGDSKKVQDFLKILDDAQNIPKPVENKKPEVPVKAGFVTYYSKEREEKYAQKFLSSAVQADLKIWLQVAERLECTHIILAFDEFAKMMIPWYFIADDELPKESIIAQCNMIDRMKTLEVVGVISP